MKPPIPYKGAKTRIAAHIASLLPSHGHYVEPFGGSLAVLLAKAPSQVETVNDIDGDLVTFWRVLRDQPEALARACILTPHARAEYYDAHSPMPAADNVESARRTFTKLTQGTTQTTVHGGMWAKYITPGTPLAAQTRRYIDRFGQAAARIADVNLDSRDALTMIRKYGRNPSVLLYLDPPYPNTSCPYPADVNHAELLDTIIDPAIRAHIALSGYPHPDIDRALHGWDRHEFPTHTGGRHGHHRPATETLWIKHAD